MKWFKGLFKHKHKWVGSAYNKWYIEIEQKCECGAYRHHFLEDCNALGEDRNWREGKMQDKL